MKNVFCSIVVAAAMMMGTAQGALVITGVVDGPLTGGTPKAIELYATTAVADLSIYGVGSANNGLVELMAKSLRCRGLPPPGTSFT